MNDTTNFWKCPECGWQETEQTFAFQLGMPGHTGWKCRNCSHFEEAFSKQKREIKVDGIVALEAKNPGIIYGEMVDGTHFINCPNCGKVDLPNE